MMDYILFAMMVLWPPNDDSTYRQAELIRQEFNSLDECKSAAHDMEHDKFCYVEICGEIRRVCYIRNAICMPKGNR